MIRFAFSVSLMALAMGGCAAPVAPAPPVGAPAAAPASAAAMTPEGARQFIAAVEKDLAELSVIGSHAAWVNATYINDDTDALNAYFGTIATEKGVKYASEAARWLQVPGLDPDTTRKLNILRGALVLAAPSSPGAAAVLNEITTRLQSAYGKGKGTLNGNGKPGLKVDVERLPKDLQKAAALIFQKNHRTVGVLQSPREPAPAPAAAAAEATP